MQGTPTTSLSVQHCRLSAHVLLGDRSWHHLPWAPAVRLSNGQTVMLRPLSQFKRGVTTLCLWVMHNGSRRRVAQRQSRLKAALARGGQGLGLP